MQWRWLVLRWWCWEGERVVVLSAASLFREEAAGPRGAEWKGLALLCFALRRLCLEMDCDCHVAKIGIHSRPSVPRKTLYGLLMLCQTWPARQ